MDINALWEETKYDGFLPEDGMYYGTVKSASTKSTDNGFEIFEITTVINEGEYAGREVNQNIFYYVPGKEDRSRSGLKTIRTLAERADSRLGELTDVYQVLTTLESLLPGRKVSLEQKSSTKDGKTYKNIWHHEIYEQPVMPY